MFEATPFVPPMPSAPMPPPVSAGVDAMAPPMGAPGVLPPTPPQFVPVPMPMPIQAPKPRKQKGMTPRLIRSALSTYGTPDMGPSGPVGPAPVGPPSPMAQATQLKPGWGGGK